MQRNTIESYHDIASHDLKDSTSEHITNLLNSGLQHVVHVPEWLVEKEDLPTVGPDENLMTGRVEDHSEKSISVTTHDTEHYLPKSRVTVFERGSERIDSPQQGLTDFAGGDA